MMGHVMLGLLFERFRYEQSVKNKKVATLNNRVKQRSFIFASQKARCLIYFESDFMENVPWYRDVWKLKKRLMAVKLKMTE